MEERRACAAAAERQLVASCKLPLIQLHSHSHSSSGLSTAHRTMRLGTAQATLLLSLGSPA